jgi:peptidoglycan/LPS O-acetylase OafA/YrhL
MSTYRITEFLGFFSVGGFVFLSAYRITRSKRSVPAAQFLKDRFLRIYPPYLFAVILFTLIVYPDLNRGTYPDWPTILIHEYSLQILFPDLFGANYHTLYFVGLLFMYYFYFCIARQYLDRPKRFLLISCVVFFFTLIIKTLLEMNHFKIFGAEWFYYFFYFVGGMLFATHASSLSHHPIFGKKVLITTALCSGIMLIAVSKFVFINTWWEQTLHFLLAQLSTIPIYIFLLSKKISLKPDNRSNRIIRHLSYPALSVFLFHRPIWTVMKMFWPVPSFFQWVYIVPFGTVFIFSASYAIQFGYDKVARQIESAEDNKEVPVTVSVDPRV